MIGATKHSKQIATKNQASRRKVRQTVHTLPLANGADELAIFPELKHLVASTLRVDVL